MRLTGHMELIPTPSNNKMVTKVDLKGFFTFTEYLAKESGKILLKEQNKVKIVKYKDRNDIATSADLASEEFITKQINKRFPEHSILSEEKGELDKGSNYRWIIDPLDGTKEYVRGIPLWNVSIGLEYKKEVIVSVVYRPYEDSLYRAAKGFGSSLNGKKIKVSDTDKLEDSFVYCYLPSYHRNRQNYAPSFQKLSEIGKIVYRLRSVADENSAMCWLAHGGIEAYINLSNPPKWHDIAPGLLVAKESGAYITDASGKQIKTGGAKSLLAANNKSVHNALLRIINET